VHSLRMITKFQERVLSDLRRMRKEGNERLIPTIHHSAHIR